MEKILLIAGCSHAAGSEIDGSEDSDYNRFKSFGGQLALSLGYRPLNIAVAGATNSSIMRSVLKWFQSSYNPKKMKVGVLIAWTESLRLEYPVEKEVNYENSCPNTNWFDVTCKSFSRINIGYNGDTKQEQELSSYFHKFFVDHGALLELSTINYILTLQYFFESNKIKYVMCNSLQTFTFPNKHLGFYLDLIDRNKYMGLDNPGDAFYIKYKNEGHTNPNAKYWHHDETPHQLYAIELRKFIEKNKCL